MKIVITGGTGFIGTALAEALVREGHSGFIISRRAGEAGPVREQAGEGLSIIGWEQLERSPQLLQNVDAVINLAGETISQRWTAAAKNRMRRSRLETALRLSVLLRSADACPQVLIQASGVHAYGFSASETFTEDSRTTDSDFLSALVRDWEEAAEQIPARRRVIMRLGIVLGESGGALPKMLLPFRLFAGGPVGDGRQWMSWIHREDLVNLILFALDHDILSGAVNAVAPQPVTNSEFGRAAAAALSRPFWLTAPAVPLRLLLGEMAGLLLEGQRVLPAKALQSGFSFRYPDIRSAFAGMDRPRRA